MKIFKIYIKKFGTIANLKIKTGLGIKVKLEEKANTRIIVF